ncbi:hypothetical protein EYD10_09286 [Varanus komodoensis]|nr:hypothetical protein EYD10_09286 [Varanus komodoensis]
MLLICRQKGFAAAKFVVQWLCNQENQHIQRIAVNIISILALKLSDEQAAQLTSEFYIVVGKLLEIVEQKTNQNELDTTFHFTLSALWNLTDEAPTTCGHFMDNKGLELFMRVLETFSSDSSIQHKVLGLLNNVSEVKELHPKLMQKDFIEHVSELLSSVEMEVSYFSAGIIANLLSRGEQAWTLSQTQRRSLIEKLHSALLKWPTPECKMVALPAYSEQQSTVALRTIITVINKRETLKFEYSSSFVEPIELIITRVRIYEALLLTITDITFLVSSGIIDGIHNLHQLYKSRQFNNKSKKPVMSTLPY